MRTKVYRNLDRPFSLFGIKGRYIAIMGAVALCVLILSIAVGLVTNTFIGIATAVIGIVIDYMAITEVQQRFGMKAVGRKTAGIGLPKHIIVRSKIWKRSI